jgi:hypothetical protein
VPTKSHAKLDPRHLVAVLNSGGEVSPPSTRGSTKLLGREQGLLDLSIVQKLKFGLNDTKPVICLQRISCLGKHWQVRCQEVGVGSLHPWLAVGRACLTLHEVLRQHPHELVLHGQQLLEAHRRQRWRWWRGCSMSSMRSSFVAAPA